LEVNPTLAGRHVNETIMQQNRIETLHHNTIIIIIIIITCIINDFYYCVKN